MKSIGQVAIEAKQNGKYGYIDSNGKWLIRPKYDLVSDLDSGYFNIWIKIPGSCCNDHCEYKKGLNDINDHVLLRPVWDWIGSVNDGIVLVSYELNDSTGYFNVKKRAFLPKFFKSGEDFSCGLAAVMNSTNHWGYINTSGQLVIPYQYGRAENFERDSALVYGIGGAHYIDKQGKKLSNYKKPLPTPAFYRIGNSYTGYGRLNSRGDTIMKPVYSDFAYRQGVAFSFRKGEKYGLADTFGVILIPPEYNFLSYFSEELAPAEKNGKWGYVDISGKEVTGFQYEYARWFSCGLGAVKQNGHWGVINKRGRLVVKPVFEELGTFTPIYGHHYHVPILESDEEDLGH